MVLNYLKIIVLHLEHLDSLGERHANRLMSWFRLYYCVKITSENAGKYMSSLHTDGC